MSGVACGYAFTAAGLETIIIERGEIAEGSTSANTGMLQFCNDIMLCDLMEQIGRKSAIQFYQHCKWAVNHLVEAAQALPVDVGFRRRSSLYYASSEQDLPKLKKEYEALKASGFDVEYWTDDDISASFPFRKPGAIVTHGDAEINPYQFVTGLAEVAVKAGLQIYEGTDVTQHEKLSNGKHRLHTSEGYAIDAEHIVFAIGYEPEELSGKLIKANLNRSYAIVTGVVPKPALESWHERFMIWETARPYHYMRTTFDGRIIIGGLDEEIEQPVQSKQMLQRRSSQLLQHLQALFPGMDTSIEFQWNATFGESQDNLPFVGQDPVYPGVYYSLGYGGNGTVYSMLGAHILSNLIQKKGSHPLPFISMR